MQSTPKAANRETWRRKSKAGVFTDLRSQLRRESHKPIFSKSKIGRQFCKRPDLFLTNADRESPNLLLFSGKRPNVPTQKETSSTMWRQRATWSLSDALVHHPPLLHLGKQPQAVSTVRITRNLKHSHGQSSSFKLQQALGIVHRVDWQLLVLLVHD